MGGEIGVIADFRLSIVGHSLGEGMTIDGYLLLVATLLLIELESLIGRSPSDSDSVISYISSKSLRELRLLNNELWSDCVSELAGDIG